jgi:hypothetical protein
MDKSCRLSFVVLHCYEGSFVNKIRNKAVIADDEELVSKALSLRA